MKNSVNKKLKDQYEMRSETPSADLWSRIECGLDMQEKEPQKNSFGFLKMAAVILLLLTTGTALFWVFNEIKPKTTEVVLSQHQKKASGKSNAIPEESKWATAEENRRESVTTSTEVPAEKRIKTEPVQPVEKQLALTPRVTDSIITPAAKQDVATRGESAEKPDYLTAEDLIFGRELEKVSADQQKENKEKIGLEVKKPREVKVLGVTVYSEE